MSVIQFGTMMSRHPSLSGNIYPENSFFATFPHKILDIFIHIYTYIYIRDVLINLRLEGPAAVSAGAEGHVCELQLVLRPIYELR